tara:strand:+ start:511 stop:1245 length:735 start_codon:yes stop_codon:yes gene_type:complete
MNLLKINSISKKFGVLQALNEVNISIEKNTFHGLIGPNGSGKSTLLKTIAGAHYADSGEIIFKNSNITNNSPELRSQKGLNLKFQITAILPQLTVYDNLLLALQTNHSIWDLISSKSKYLYYEKIIEVLENFKLIKKVDTLAGELSHGLQQWLEIAMVVVKKPELLLLDEPTAGMSPQERQVTGELLVPLKSYCSLIIVEHDLDFIKDICDYITVLDQGKVLETGSIEKIRTSKKVQEVYTTRV